MPDTIRDGAGTGTLAKVDNSQRIWTRAKNIPYQHSVSEEEQDAYQAPATPANLVSGTTVGLHMKNIDTTKRMVITYIRHQIVGATNGTAFPNTSNYFSVRIGREYASGGTLETPVNVFAGSARTANITVYSENPTLTGTATEIDRWYTKANGDMHTFSKEGSLIIPPGQSIEFSYVGDHSDGIIYSRVSFVMDAD